MSVRYLRALERRTIASTSLRIRTRPDFAIIGAMKAGTTSLFSWLSEHPDVVPAARKELHFFDIRWHRGLGHYWLDFPLRPRMALLGARRGRPVVTGESTPSYLLHPLAADRMHSALPDIKVIVLLRDPVMRAISHYRHSVRSGLETLSLGEALAAEPERMAPEFERIEHGEEPSPVFRVASYVTRGLYAEQLRRWTAVFPADQLLLVPFQDLALRPSNVYADVLRFVGVDPSLAPNLSFRAENVADPGELPDEEATAWLRARFREPNVELAEEFGITFDR